MASFLPTHVYEQFRFTKIEAEQLTMLVIVMGFSLWKVGGYISDRVGGIKTLNGVLLLVSATLMLCGLAGQSLVVTTLLSCRVLQPWGLATAHCFNWCRCVGP